MYVASQAAPPDAQLAEVNGVMVLVDAAGNAYPTNPILVWVDETSPDPTIGFTSGVGGGIAPKPYQEPVPDAPAVHVVPNLIPVQTPPSGGQNIPIPPTWGDQGVGGPRVTPRDGTPPGATSGPSPGDVAAPVAPSFAAVTPASVAAAVSGVPVIVWIVAAAGAAFVLWRAR